MRADPHPEPASLSGGGLGGLVSAALLSDAGLKVIVAEQHVVAGGYCQHWIRKVRHAGAVRAFRFDGGLHDFSGVRDGATITELLRNPSETVALSLHRPTLPSVLKAVADRLPNGLKKKLPAEDPYLKVGEIFVAHVARPRGKATQVVAVEQYRPTTQ